MIEYKKVEGFHVCSGWLHLFIPLNVPKFHSQGFFGEERNLWSNSGVVLPQIHLLLVINVFQLLCISVKHISLVY